MNLSAPFHLARAAIAPMASQGGGRIVNVGSVTAAMGNPVEAGYGAAKAGLLGLTRSLARAVARKGITVNLVVPERVRHRDDQLDAAGSAGGDPRDDPRSAAAATRASSPARCVSCWPTRQATSRARW